MNRVQVRIHGRVQGVMFRDSCRREAERLAVTGWVRNEPDGSVGGEFEGDAVDDLVAWCRTGPPGAQVSRVEVLEVQPVADSRFEVRW